MAFSIEVLNYDDRSYRNDLLRRLREHIFHLTTIRAFESISGNGFIFANQAGQYPINTGSEKSFGRSKGWVCLLDLREKSENEIDDILFRYDFLGPGWFKESLPNCTELKLAYFILSATCYHNLLSNEKAQVCLNSYTGHTQYIPRAECWFPGDLPLDYIEKVFHVNIVLKSRGNE